MHKLTTFKNGLRLITVPMPHVESVTVMVGVAAGSRNETKGVSGLFHFIEHMAFKGTKKRPSPLTLTSVIDGIGGQFHAFTDKEITGYYVKLAAKHTELAFDILADVLANSLFKSDEIEKEKGVIIEEINMYEDTPSRRILDIFTRLLYGNNPMGWDIGGTKESVRRIQKKDFLAFQKRLYFTKNMAVIVAGKMNEEKITRLNQKYFGDFRQRGRKTREKILLAQKKPRLKISTKKTQQAHFCLGVPGVSYSHPLRFPVGVLATVLGGGMSSRVSQEVRVKRGLAYYVFVQPEFHTDSGFVLAWAGVKVDKIEEAIKVVLDELYKLTKKIVPQKELSKAKEYLKGGMILSLEDSFAVANRYAYQALLEKKLRPPQEAMKLIDAVTAQDVQRAAQEFLQPQKLNLAIIGPYKDKVRFRKLLRL
jgi:predicted Zn-dependent peptidase